jgi:hypothetical protein
VRRSPATVLCLLLLAGRAAADEARDFRRQLEVQVIVERGFPARLSEDRGTLAVSRGDLWFNGRVPTGNHHLLRWKALAEQAHYRFSDPDAVVPGTGVLLDGARVLRLAPVLERRFYGGWGLAAGPIVQSAGADGADFARTLTWGGQASARIPLRSKAGLVVGAAIEGHLEGPPTYWPILGIEGTDPGRVTIDWRPNGVRVGYALVPSLSVGVAGRYDRRDIRLATDARVPSGVFRDRRWALGADVAWKPGSCFEAYASVWRNIVHDVVIGDRDGSPVAELDADDSWQVGLTISVRL